MDYKVVSKILKQESGNTEVRIVLDTPYTFITRELPGDRTQIADEQVIKEVISILGTELNPTSELNLIKEEIKKLNKKTDTVIKAVVHVSDLDDGTKENIINSYPEYNPNKFYEKDEVFNYNGELYTVVQAHQAQLNYVPTSTPALYGKYLNYTTTIPDENGEPIDIEVINDFVPPTGAHDSYALGAKVKFNGKIYESTINNNSYSPTDYPQRWKEVI